MALLEVRHLRTRFQTPKGVIPAVNDVSFTLEPGQTLGLVGESGSGKSVSAMSILNLLGPNGLIAGGEILFDGQDLTKFSPQQLRQIRGNQISVIFQEPMTSLNPVFSIQRQLSEPFLVHQGMNKKEAAAGALEMLRAVQLPDPQRVLKKYPHQLSGGMRQRVMIAMALACQPRILIADEPTTALDVTIQAQILDLMQKLQAEKGTGILFITHDLGIIRQMADRVAVMYCGQVVEQCDTRSLFAPGPVSHPYTEGLLQSIPRTGSAGEPLKPIPGAVPHPLEQPKGCKFTPRCPYATARCVEKEPALLEVAPGHWARCHYAQKEVRRSEEHRKALLHPEA